MLTTIKNAWNIPELRKRILFTLAMLCIFRLGGFIAVPFIDTAAVDTMVNNNSMFGLLNIISGNNFRTFSIFAMSITPYINASIILQLLTIAIPALERLSHEGEEGRKKISSYTRYLTVVLALIQALGIAFSFKQILTTDSAFTVAVVALTITAGTSFLMWLGENITEHGIGNGISILIFAGIIANIPSALGYLYEQVTSGSITGVLLVIFLVFVILVIAGVVEI
ncbi:preprotein translocase subunit SecY, partial [Anaerofustis stercorihominis]